MDPHIKIKTSNIKLVKQVNKQKYSNYTRLNKYFNIILVLLNMHHIIIIKLNDMHEHTNKHTLNKNKFLDVWGKNMTCIMHRNCFKWNKYIIQDCEITCIN